MASFSNNEVEQVLHNVFEKRCIQCENVAPVCQNGCPTGQLCSLTAYDDCNRCPEAVCIPDPDFKGTPAGQDDNESGPNVGAIAGGVIGGVAVILVCVWLLWRFFIRDRRRQQEAEEEEWQASEDTTAVEKMDSDQFTMRRDARNSTHTVASMASSILTRASNVIQIAYIPGITNRSGPESPDVLVPPVPPIPLALSHGSAPNSPYASTEDSHYFMPSDLRDSTYTAYTDDPRNSYATRASITPSLARSSVATTIYRNDAVINPMPATTIVRGKAAMVSVRNKDGSANGSPVSTPGAETPPLPMSAQAKLRQAPIQIKMPASGSNAKGNVMSTAQMGKPVALTLTKKKPSNSSLSSSLAPASALDPRDLGAVSPRPQTATSEASESDFEDEHARSRRSLLGHDRDSRGKRESQGTIISDSPMPTYSPFMDMSSSIGSPLRSQTRPGVELATVVESPENSRRQSKESKDLVGEGKGKSPFGDENALR